MKKCLVALSVLYSVFIHSQRMTIGLSYEYFYSVAMDKIIQTYNFDRPFLQNKQPLFTNGLNASFSIFKKREQKWTHGFYSSYSFLKSYAENESFGNRFLLNLMDLGYALRYQDTSSLGRFYSELQVTTKFSGLFRRTNGDAFIYDDMRSRSFGIGGCISWLIGYSFQLKNNNSVSPTFQLICTPYIYAPNNESVINGTKGLISESWQTLFSTRFGVTYNLRD
jgi:hypothetical protein